MWARGDPGNDAEVQWRGLAEPPAPQPHSGTPLPPLKQKDICGDTKTCP